MPYESAKAADMVPVIASIHKSLHFREMHPSCRESRPERTCQAEETARITRPEDIGAASVLDYAPNLQQCQLGVWHVVKQARVDDAIESSGVPRQRLNISHREGDCGSG